MVNVVRNHLERFCIQHGYVNMRMVVAVSGGIDSTVLLHALSTLRDSLGLDLVVAHANHGLRGIESDDDERFVTSVSEAYHLPAYTERLAVTAYAQHTGLGIEASARTLRYAFLENTAVNVKSTVVAVAHTADDVAETLIANLARGSGLDGLASHAPIRPLTDAVTVIRPMLALQRSEVVEYAIQHGLAWREDSSNADLQYQRNRIRHEVLPVLRSVFGADVGERIARTAELLRDAQQIVRSASADVQCFDVADDRLHIYLAPFQILSPALQREVLRTALQKVDGYQASYADVHRIQLLIDAEPGSQASLSSGLVCWRERDELLVENNTQRADSPLMIQGDGLYNVDEMCLEVKTLPAHEVVINPNQTIAYIDASCVVGTMQCRRWEHGERFVPFGMNTSVLIADVLTNARIPVSKRKHIRVVSDASGILWVCGVRQAEHTRITRSTTHVITMRIS